VRINEAEPEGPAPRFFLVRTVEGNLWRIRYDLPTEVSERLEQLASEEPVAPDSEALRQPPRYVAEYIGLLGPVDESSGGPAYYLPEIEPSKSAVLITSENADLLQAHFPFTLSYLEEREPVAVIVQDGAAVAACFSARSTARVAEAGVFTLEAYRGRGYAAETVRAWAGAIRASGRLPLYSTSWENKASQAVAAQLGAVLYAVDFSLT
jgi:hypothetical protein